MALEISKRDCLMVAVGAAAVLVGMGMGHIVKTRQLPLKPESDHVTIAWLPPTIKRWDKAVEAAAKEYKLDPNLIAIIIALESGGYSKAKSEAGAQGLMQITPLTAKDIASKFLIKPRAQYNLLDPPTNIEFGTAYLAYLRKEFGTYKQGPDWNATAELIATGYNGGPGAANNLEQGKGLRDTQTVVYSRDVFNMWRERHAKTSPTFERWLERGGSRLVDQAKTEH